MNERIGRGLKLFLVVILMVFLTPIAQAQTIEEFSFEDIKMFIEEQYNPNVDKLPSFIKNFFGNERMNVYIDGIVVGLVSKDGRIIEVKEGEISNPTVKVFVKESTAGSIMHSDDPVTAFQIALKYGEIRVEGVRVVNWVKYSMANVITRIVSNIGILKSPYDVKQGEEKEIIYKGEIGILKLNSKGIRFVEFPGRKKVIIIDKYGGFVGLSSRNVQELIRLNPTGLTKNAGIYSQPKIIRTVDVLTEDGSVVRMEFRQPFSKFAYVDMIVYKNDEEKLKFMEYMLSNKTMATQIYNKDFNNRWNPLLTVYVTLIKEPNLFYTLVVLGDNRIEGTFNITQPIIQQEIYQKLIELKESPDAKILEKEIEDLSISSNTISNLIPATDMDLLRKDNILLLVTNSNISIKKVGGSRVTEYMSLIASTIIGLFGTKPGFIAGAIDIELHHASPEMGKYAESQIGSRPGGRAGTLHPEVFEEYESPWGPAYFPQRIKRH